MTRREWAWISYDWANNAFPTVVTTFVIAAYFTRGIAPDPVSGQVMWGWMQALVGIAIAGLSPVLGAVADAGRRRRSLLAITTVLMALFSAGIWFAEPAPAFALWALLCVALGTLSFELGTVFYNAMLTDVATPDRVGRVSGMGWAAGYGGGLCCLLLSLGLLVQPSPPLFGLDAEMAEPVRATALLVAVWTLIFAVPVLVVVPDPPGFRPSWRVAAAQGLTEVVALFRRLPQKPALLRFLVARVFYTDGLNVLFVFGAVFAAGVFDMDFQEILLFGIAINVTAGIGAFAGGFVEERLGARNTVLFSLLALMGVGAGILLVQDKALFWALGVCLGLFFGPAQASSRSLMAKMAPQDEISAHFGMFALSGRVTSFLGPALLAVVTEITGSQRWGMSVVLLLLGGGAAVLLTVRAPDRG